MKNTNVTNGIFAVVVLTFIFMSGLASADSYQLRCLTDGETLHFEELCPPFGDPYHCSHDYCGLCVHNLDNGKICPTHPGNCQNSLSCLGGGNASVDSEPPNVTINSPIEGEVYSNKNILLDVEATESSNIKYKINDDNSWKNVCGDCMEHASNRNFEEGFNEVTVRAEDDDGNVGHDIVSFIVDSKSPKIKKTEPQDGFASGNFHIELEEANPTLLKIHYGNFDIGMRTHEINIDSQCDEGINGKFFCDTSVDLSDFDGETIEYFVEVEDIASNTDMSDNEELMVDYSAPVINSVEILEADDQWLVSGSKATFFIEIDEPNLKEVLYLDNNDANPRWKKLCTKLVNEVCQKKISLKDGAHDVDIQVVDKAGHSIGTNIDFFTDSKAPRINDVQPDGEFASGEFYVQFVEINPAQVILEYGNSMEHEVNIAQDCTQDGDEYECTVGVDVSGFEGEEIDYEFKIIDVVGNTDADGEGDLTVDTVNPQVGDITYVMSGSRKADITVPVVEDNFDSIKYSLNGGSWKSFCTKLKNGVCKKGIILNTGENSLDFIVSDEAGNVVEENLSIPV